MTYARDTLVIWVDHENTPAILTGRVAEDGRPEVEPLFGGGQYFAECVEIVARVPGLLKALEERDAGSYTEGVHDGAELMEGSLCDGC